MTAVAATGLVCEVSYRAVIDGLKAAALALAGSARGVTRRVELLAVDDTLVVTATAPEVADIRVRIPAESLQAGVMLVEHTQLMGLLAAATKGAVKRDLDRAVVRLVDRGDEDTISVEVAGYQLPIGVTRDVSSYPQGPVMPDAAVVVDREAFTAMFGRVQPAAGTDTYLPLFSGVQLLIEAGSVALLATDRYRIARGYIDTAGTNTPAGSVLPGALTAKLLKLLAGDQLRIGTADQQGRAWTTIATDTITAHLAAPTTGDYPKLLHLFDTPNGDVVTVERAPLAAAAARAAAIVGALTTSDHATVIDVGADTLTLTPRVDHGTAHAPAIPITRTGDTEPWTSAANPAYLTAGIAAFTTDTIDIHLGQPRKPIKLSDPTGTYDHVVMPMRLPN